MPYEFYKILHISSILGVFMALGGLALHAMHKGEPRFPGRTWAMLFHGVGLALVLVSGFGLMARLGVPQGNWPLWIWLKFATWLALGGVAALVLRAQKFPRLNWVIVLALGVCAAMIANLKPM